mgnify:CR=1 FL=1
MTKLEQLIKELCPNGVEYKKLGEVATISRGGNFQKKDFCEDGVPCIHYGQIYTRYGLFADKTLTFISEEAAKKQKYAVKNDIVMAVTSENIDDVCKCVAWLGDDEIAISGHTAIIHHTLNPKYLCYYFHTAMFYAQKKKLAHGTKVIEVTPDKLTDITIPVPPIEIQVEIVKILDEYSTSVTALQQELEKELTARKKQYEYYRDLLLDFGVHGGGTSECEWRTLGEMFPFIRNGFVGTVTPFYTDKENGVRYLQGTNIHNGVISDNEVFYITKEFHEKHKKNELQSDDILMVQSGHVGECAVVGEKYKGSNCHALIILSNGGQCDSNYVRYYLQSTHGKRILVRITTGGTVKHILASKMKNVVIPFPPIEEQKRIVSTLDRFDKLCNDISEGLPAEIEARRKQYEYYRDRLLSFEERKNA